MLETSVSPISWKFNICCFYLITALDSIATTMKVTNGRLTYVMLVLISQRYEIASRYGHNGRLIGNGLSSVK